METLNLGRLDVIHAGTFRYRLASRIEAVPAAGLAEMLLPHGSPRE
ncbi:MAG: hypothetical protein OXH08_07115 [Gammaproteobacteria bacterium]|nr:hypothetical protein [Gammaproteobacteria bacterium]